MNGYYAEKLTQADVRLLMGNCNTCPPEWRAEGVCYSFHKFYYFQGGQCRLEIEGDVYHPKPGELYLIPAGKRHSYSHSPKDPVTKYWCHFDLSFGGIRELNYQPQTVVCVPERTRTAELFDRMFRLHGSASPADRLLEKAALLELLAVFLERIDVQKLLGRLEDDFSYQMSRYVQEHLSGPIRVGDMAEAVHLQPSYFIQKFKKNFQVTPICYVNQMRLQNAARLMEGHPGDGLEELARASGFDDYRYFSRLFRKYYGMTPSEFRKRQAVIGQAHRKEAFYRRSC